MGVGGVGYIMNSRLTWATQKEAVSKDPKRNEGGVCGVMAQWIEDWWTSIPRFPVMGKRTPHASL